MAKDFSDVTWREFYDARRDRPHFHAKMAEKLAQVDGTAFKALGEGRWSYFSDEFTAEGVGGARELAFTYAVYRDKVLDDGGEPSPFERPTTDGWS